MSPASQPVVLVVDDEAEIRRTYSEILRDEYDVRTAGSGTEALDGLGEGVDAVLLDRRMPDLAGDEVLERIRGSEYECRVAMVSGVEPDFDILEMGFDDYLVKPVDPRDLRNVVDSLVYWGEYDAVVQEYLTKAARIAALEAEKAPEQLEEHEGYAGLTEDLDKLKVEAESVMAASIERGEFDQLLRNTDL